MIPSDAPRSEWVKVLTKCIKNPDHVREMGENLHKVTEEYFDLNKVAKHRLELYEQSMGLVLSRDLNTSGVNFNTEWTFE